MAMVFKFRMLSDESDSFARDFEVAYDMNLLDFHNFICDRLKYDKNEMSSFFSSDRYWEKLREYTLDDMGGGYENCPVPMADVTLGQIIHKNNDRMIYVFDILNDRALYLELIATLKAGEGVKYPRETYSEGEAPDQYEPGKTGTEGNSIFDDALGEFGSFEGDDMYDDEF